MVRVTLDTTGQVVHSIYDYKTRPLLGRIPGRCWLGLREKYAHIFTQTKLSCSGRLFRFLFHYFHATVTAIFRLSTLYLPAPLSVNKDFGGNIRLKPCAFPFRRPSESYKVFIYLYIVSPQQSPLVFIILAGLFGTTHPISLSKLCHTH